MSTWVEGRVAGRRDWTDTLFSLQVDAPSVTFAAGQFARLALPAPPGAAEPMIGRPYSFVDPPGAPLHEFYGVVVPGGALSPRLAALSAGDPVWLLPTANGFFTVSEVPAADVLWCLSTGTGLGPFLSILRTGEPWQRFGRVVLVHGVRRAAELAYGDVIAGIAREHAGAFAYVPVVSREPAAGTLPGRIPALIADGRLEAAAGAPLTADSAHAMICGNPAMVDDAREVLAGRGMRKHRRREPGHVTVETYW
jgi:ferredoxin/flavodoxin---NADP+ reductase